MKRILLVGLGLFALAATQSAVAADRPLPYKAPPAVVPIFTWTGWYVGVDGGYGWGTDSDITFTAPATGFTGTSQGFRSTGGFGGGQIGFNQQTGQWVWGLEADIQGSGIRDAFNVTVPSNGGPLGVNAQQRLNYFGTVRGRLGLAVDHSLFYATGGFAYGGVKDNILLTNGGATALLMRNYTGTGFAVGGGWEYNFAPAWSVKVEYQYIDLGSKMLSGVSTNAVLLNSTNIDAKFHTVRVGLNYGFAWGMH
jgi:outer membrane immunogenic protein